MSPATLHLALAAFLLLPLRVSAQQPAFGPLGTSERNPVYELFYVPIPEGADVLARSRTRADVAFAYSNIFESREGDALQEYFDLERLTTTVTVRRGMGRGWELGGRISFQTNWAGFLDPLIQGLHGAFNLPNGDREQVPNGQYGLVLWDSDGEVLLRVPERRFGPEDVQLFAKWAVRAGEGSALSLRATVELPTGVEGTGTGRGDLGVEALWRRSWTRWHLHALSGVSTLNAPAWARPWTRSAAFYALIAGERSLGSVALLAQLAGSSPYLVGAGVSELDHAATLLTLGVAGTRGVWRWQVGFVEDVPPNSPSVDFTVHVQFTRISR